MNNTKLLYMEQPALYEGKAKIEDIIINEDDRQIIVLDQTIFYPKGGGQPYDTGTIHTSDALFNVKEVFLVEGVVHHIGNFEKGNFNKGDEVALSIDKDRHDLNARLHSAGHLVDEAVHLLGYNLPPTKGNHYPGEASVSYAGEIDTEQEENIAKLLTNKLAEMIAEGFEVITKIVDRRELEKLCENVPDYIPKDKPTRISIVWGENAIPCGGTLVKNIKDIGKINIKKVKCKKGEIKVSYDVK